MEGEAGERQACKLGGGGGDRLKRGEFLRECC